MKTITYATLLGTIILTTSCDNQNIDDIYLPSGHMVEVFMTDTTMTARGEVLSNGGDYEGIISRGFCWSLDSLPTISDQHIYVPNANPSFMGGEVPYEADIFQYFDATDTNTYFIRTFHENRAGVSYHGPIKFTLGNPDGAKFNSRGCLECKELSKIRFQQFRIDGKVYNMPPGTTKFRYNITWNNWDASRFCTSNITDMRNLFTVDFNQDISTWDVSNVVNMSEMFSAACCFNQDIGNWDVSNVTNMSAMFRGSLSFNQDIGNWDVSNVTNMSEMFKSADDFNQDISNWDVSNVTDMSSMFDGQGWHDFNQDIGSWDVSNVTDMKKMFYRCKDFNHDIGDWDVENVHTTGFNFMLSQCLSFNQDLTDWCVPSFNGTIYPVPAQFADPSGLAASNYPVWGTCP